MEKLNLIFLVLFATCNNNDKVVVSGYSLTDSLDKKSQVYHFIKPPVINNYKLTDSIENKKYDFKLYKFEHKQKESVNTIYSIVDNSTGNLFVIPSPLLFTDNYETKLDSSDISLFNGFVNPKYYAVFHRDLEYFYNFEYQIKGISWKALIEINDFVLKFYFKNQGFEENHILNNEDSVDVLIDDYLMKKIKSLNLKKEISLLRPYLKNTIKSQNCKVYNFNSHVWIYELYRDTNDTLNKMVSLDFKCISKDYFYFKDILYKKN